MKNKDIITLVGAGILQATVHSLSPAHAYKFSKLRHTISAIYKDIIEQEKELLVDAGINEKTDLINGNYVFPKKEDGSNDESKWLKFIELRKAMYEEDAPLVEVKKIPYEEWLLLYNENAHKNITLGREDSKEIYIDIFGSTEVENILLGLLFDYPIDEPPASK
jgi:hypothetical protein